MSQGLKIIIPAAGWATRLRPQTWSKPKPLVGVAGQAAIDHLLASFASVPDLSTGQEHSPQTAEYVMIVSPNVGETQIPEYMKLHHPDYVIHYIVQSSMRGQSDAIRMAKDFLSGPVIICFSDTLIETDFSFLAKEEADAIAWVKPVPDPRRFGVVEVNREGRVTRLIEKPVGFENTQVVVGCYYFRDGCSLVTAIDEQMRHRKSINGEYYLADAINMMLQHGLKMRVQTADVWLDLGTIEATLETNRYLLEHGRDNTSMLSSRNIRIVPPVFIHESATIQNSTIGPGASIGAECCISDSQVEDSILEDGAVVHTAFLKGSFIGRQARVEGKTADSDPMALNIGDNSTVIL